MCRNESKDIPRLVDRISYELLSLMERYEASAETSSDTYLIGIETRVQELKSLLEVGSGDVRMVGVYGMWGSGKSTLASYIYDEISHEFEGCCFVKDVTARSTMHGLKTLQEEILSNVLKLKVTLTNIEQGKHMMKSLCQNSVLIVLDDVYHTVHLEMLVGSHNWFGNGSRIIFTTRNQDLAKARGFLPCNVLMLEPKEAIELFSRHAFGKSRPLPGFEDVSLIMVSKFGGHPSALISLGSFLHGKDRSVWMRILDILVCKPVDEILKKFETPDDGLARNIWLDFLLRGSESCLLDNLDGLRVEYGLENGLNN
ncbi:TMV resistance protein N-like [Helianthus annuus]|uniref:TMV resistance protein N-like n=1 Tax=Helianthus annuus TaxID=4232 RepID=UPI000B8F86D6|nr:TMV resistance protein N-like [Helianthus annuus]